MKTTRQAYAESDKLLATLNEVNERIIKDPEKTYLVWKGNQFPSVGSDAQFTSAAGTIDWGDGIVEMLDSTKQPFTHTYTDGLEYHLIIISGITSLNTSAFKDCNGLIEADLSNKITSISKQAFLNCINLTSVLINTINTAESTLEVNRDSFKNCSNLSKIVFKSVIPPNLRSVGITDAGDFSNATIVVPKSAIAAYRETFKFNTNEVIYLTDSSDLKNTLLLDPSLLGREIADNAWKDLNTCTLIGNYYCTTGAMAKKTSHGPAEITQDDGTPFRLVVASATGEGPSAGGGLRYPFLSQTLISLYKGAMWYRLGTWLNSVYVWSDWKQSYSDQIRTAGLNDDLTWGGSNFNKTYSRLRVVDSLPNSPGTNIIYFVTES